MHTHSLSSIHVKNRRTASEFLLAGGRGTPHILAAKDVLTQPPPSESSCVRAPLLWRPSQKTARLSRRVKKALGAATSPEAKYHTRPRPANNMCAVRSESPSRVTTTCLYSPSCLHRASARPLAKQPNRPLSALEDAPDVSLRMLEVCARGTRESGLRLWWDAPQAILVVTARTLWQGVGCRAAGIMLLRARGFVSQLTSIMHGRCVRMILPLN